MPELPEVETVRRSLSRCLEGRVLLGVETRFPGVLLVPGTAVALPATFLRAERKGKLLILRFARDRTLLVHLRMTGHLSLADSKKDLPPHTHVVFSLDDGRFLVYRDPRRFGRLVWYENLPDEKIPELNRLGPDALSIEKGEFVRILRSHHRMIKPLLLDQSILSGLGNIYVDELLFLGRVHPQRKSSGLSLRKGAELWRGMNEILLEAIEEKGSTVRDFVGSTGEPGGYQKHHRVYGRAGEPCMRCGGPLRRIVVAQRGTTYCPRCQRKTG